MKLLEIIRETFQYARKVRMCVFSKRRYEEWKCILLKGIKVMWSSSCLFLNGKENKGQTNMDTESCVQFFKKEPLHFPGGTVVKNLPVNTGDTGLSPGPGRSHMPRSN